MINSITIDLTNFYDRQPWGVVYRDFETDAIVDSDYCDDVAECISSLYEHRGNFHFVCTADFALPASPYDSRTLDAVIEDITAHFDELGVSGWTCLVASE